MQIPIGPSSPPSNPTLDCTSCTLTRNIVVNYNTVSNAIAYQVRWKKASDSNYTLVTPNPTGNSVIISGVPVCESITVGVKSICDNSSQSTEVFSTVAPLGFPLKCGCTYYNSEINPNFFIRTVPLDLSAATNGATIYLNYDAQTRPNKFYIYNETTLTTVVNSGWVGDGGYPGQWSPGQPGMGNGNISFTYNSAHTYTLKVETAGKNPSSISDDDYWLVNLSCGSTSGGGSGTGYYYYSGTLCGGGSISFRSVFPGLLSTGAYKVYNNLQQEVCVSNVQSIAANAGITNGLVVDTRFNNCSICNNSGSNLGCCYIYEITNYFEQDLFVSYTDCNGYTQYLNAASGRGGSQTYSVCAIEGSVQFGGTLCENSSFDCMSIVRSNTTCGGNCD